MQFLYTLITKKYNNATSDNIVLYAYMKKSFLKVVIAIG